MVSKANEDLPEPDRPVMTVKVPRGMSRSKSLRLWVRAPRMRSGEGLSNMRAPPPAASGRPGGVPVLFTLYMTRGRAPGKGAGWPVAVVQGSVAARRTREGESHGGREQGDCPGAPRAGPRG